MTKTTISLRRWLAAAWMLAAGVTHAADWRPDGFVVQGGVGKDGAGLVGAGVLWDWDFQLMRRKAELTAHTELLVNQWRYDALGGGHASLTQLVLLPTLRINFSQGRSPWYLELGIGASWMNKSYVTPDKQFSTRWNFYDVLGVGYKFGADKRHEIGLRYVHISNGGVRKPNPGEDFLQLRYVQRF
ncbi:MAG TPA: acyloxyacyl hydrolase [Ramlibacter sp.]|jgi:hypothetical protein|nr:acyloxyacyl hydrolase [Ramlibacter sp.]